jgi:ribonuclease D
MVTRPLEKIAPSLLVSLRQYRTDQAYLRAVPPATVFSNKLLTSIVSARPNTITALQKLHGIGPTRCQNYGRDIVRFVNLDSKTKGKRIKDKLSKTIKDKPSRTVRNAKGGRKTKEIRGALMAKSWPKTTPRKARAKKPTKSINPAPKLGPKTVTSRFFPP